MDHLAGPCPQCGKELQIPAELSEFSCLYCGARLKPEDLSPPCPNGSAEALMAGIGSCITEHRNTISHLMPKKYDPCFESYMQAHGTLLAMLDEVSPSQHEAIANALLDHISEWIRSAKRSDALLEDAKYTLCLLFVPAVLKAAPAQGMAFCEKLRTLWLARWPKQVFQITTYAQIAGGFRSHKLCFITTAACTYLGKADDCAELTAFRSFRDGWLSCQPDGQALIAQYYHIAPGIVTAMNATEPDALYPNLWQQYLKPCYEALLRGDNKGCKQRYTQMVQYLSHHFHI